MRKGCPITHGRMGPRLLGHSAQASKACGSKARGPDQDVPLPFQTPFSYMHSRPPRPPPNRGRACAIRLPYPSATKYNRTIPLNTNLLPPILPYHSACFVTASLEHSIPVVLHLDAGPTTKRFSAQMLSFSPLLRKGDDKRSQSE